MLHQTFPQSTTLHHAYVMHDNALQPACGLVLGLWLQSEKSRKIWILKLFVLSFQAYAAQLKKKSGRPSNVIFGPVTQMLPNLTLSCQNMYNFL
ncbi:hypothetical protein ACE6H2_015335 [Prunus campanulata]